MAAPATVRAAGSFGATKGGAGAGEAVLRMTDRHAGFVVTRRSGVAPGGDRRDKGISRSARRASPSTSRSSIACAQGLGGRGDTRASQTHHAAHPAGRTGAVRRRAQRAAMKTFMGTIPNYQAEVGDTTTFWYAFGPVLYRGRLDGSARLAGHRLGSRTNGVPALHASDLGRRLRPEDARVPGQARSDTVVRPG